MIEMYQTPGIEMVQTPGILTEAQAERRRLFDALVVPPYSPIPAEPVGRFQPVPRGGKRVWINTEPWQNWVDPRHLIQALPYCESDGASVPRLFWSLASPWEPRTWASAWGHDLGYWAELLPRDELDRIFYRNLRAQGCFKIKAAVMYGAVSLCGWIPWSEHTPASILAARDRVRILEFPEDQTRILGAA
jgi:hypothetical protein